MATSKDKDTALKFLQAHRDVDATLHHDEKYTARLRRKVDLWVMPFLVLVFVLNFLDKATINYANVMGLTPDLGLQGNDFSNAGSAFWIAVLAASLPNGSYDDLIAAVADMLVYFLQRMPTGKWLGLNLLLWGICTACHAALQNYAGLLTLRVLSGLFESAIPGCLMLLSAQYYTREEQPIRFSYWFCGQGIGQIIGGLLSWAFQHAPAGGSTTGWRMMFLAIGLLSILLGAVVIILIPDTPWEAKFLTIEQKVNILEHVRVNQSGIQSHWQARQILEALQDFQVWCGLIIVLLQGIGAATIAIYSSTLLRSFGFSAKEAALLNMPPGVANIIAILFTGLMARYFGLRFIWAAITILISGVGSAMIAWSDSRAVSVAGLYLLNFAPGSGVPIWQLLLTNTAGTSKRAFVADGIGAAFAIGNIIGPQTFRQEDAPRYQPAMICLVGFYSCGVLLTLLLASYYWLCNRRRGEASATSEEVAFANLTDKQNKEFRYVY